MFSSRNIYNPPKLLKNSSILQDYLTNKNAHMLTTREFGKDLTNNRILTESSQNDIKKPNFVKKASDQLVTKRLSHKEGPFDILNKSKQQIPKRKNFSKKKNNSQNKNIPPIPNKENVNTLNFEKMEIDDTICEPNVIVKEVIKEENEDVTMVVPNSNPQDVNEYFNEIYDYLVETESNFKAEPYYMKKQNDINEKMRAILNDWLVDVHIKYKMVPETLYLTVNIIDRFLSKTIIPRTELQCVGVAAMMIASKYEDIYPPEVSDFSYITDYAYDKKHILKMESQILKVLNFDITVVTPYRLLECYKRILKVDNETFFLAQFILELSLINIKSLEFKSSELAISCLLIAMKFFKNKNLEDKSFLSNNGIDEAKFESCQKYLCMLMHDKEKCKLNAVSRKFTNVKYHEVGKIKFI